MNGIESVRTNCHDENRFEKKTAANGLFYFVLTATNGQTIGRSSVFIGVRFCPDHFSVMTTVMLDSPDRIRLR